DGSVFPSGPMREKLRHGLARADAVVVLLPADAPGVDPELLEAFGDLPVHVARLMPAAPPPKGPIVAFAGIAKPWKVERALDAAGAELIDFAPFPDHAAFREGDLAFLADRAERSHARLVTTEKDWFRLSPEWRARVLSWPVKATFEDEAGFQRLLLGALRAHSAR
ncbi:MAG TPA: tetraacyldisaccharide 4'-kinase, partial [Brevundimonas sp.]|nr:tetraacyldisaccharide 4'-kinase [Brevundimonas sp.]